METGFPLVLLVGPSLAAAVALIIRQRRRATVIFGLAVLGLLTLLLWLAGPNRLFADSTMAILGREVVLTPLTRSLFLFIYPAMGVLFVATWFRPGGRAIVPLGLAALAPPAGALMVSPAGVGTVLIVAAAAVLIPTLHGGRYEAAAAAWRYFVLITVALAPILLTISPPPDGAVSWAIPLLAALILLGGFPFHIWAGGLGRRAPHAALALALGLAQIVVVVMVLSFLDAAPAARNSVEFQAAVRWSAALTALIAAFEMWRAVDWRGLIAGALALDMGLLLAATLAPGAGGLLIALPALMSRFLSLLLITLAWGWPVGDAGGSEADPVRRWAGRLPTALLVYGCLSLIGLPLTPGFAGRWAQLAVVGDESMWPGLLLVVSLALAALATARAALRPGLARGANRVVSRGGMVFALVLLGLAALLGLFPELLVSVVSRMLGV
jgi:formate hydrogenlyase subunit 3/multisubunit Na+/H+ antiporter MnhD subunit